MKSIVETFFVNEAMTFRRGEDSQRNWLSLDEGSSQQ